MSDRPEGVNREVESALEWLSLRSEGQAHALWLHIESLTERAEKAEAFCREFIWGEENPHEFKLLDEQIATIRAEHERDAAEGDLGYNCPSCGEWNYLHPKELSSEDCVIECGNEDCAASIRIVVSYAALATSPDTEEAFHE